MSSSRLLFALSSALTIVLGAFLLFQVQPIISKLILPWFGGGPAVWSTCLLFFQVVLLAGYAYAHALTRLRDPRAQMVLHLAVLVAAAITLPIYPSAAWKPADAAHPTTRILALLAANIGLPYFVLAATSPLVQAWFARVIPDRTPYRLYALSNLGSLGALLTYPFLVEPTMTTRMQGIVWSVLFACFAAACGALAVGMYRAVRSGTGGQLEERSPESSGVCAELPAAGQRLGWLLLPALATVMLMAVTNHLSQDIAVVPLFWVVPLSLYLLSFIICFDREMWYRRRFFSLLMGCAVFGLSLILLEDELEHRLRPYFEDVNLFEFMDSIVMEAAVYLTVLFLICMVCHGELVRAKPQAKFLTEFYLMVASGGALGGIFVALVCPLVFSSLAEIHLGLVAAFMLAMSVFWDSLWNTWLLRKTWRKCVVFALGFGLLLVVVRAQFVSLQSTAKLSLRNFYGVLSVKEHDEDDPDLHTRDLMNGRILHGTQFQDLVQRRLPTTYYNDTSGVGVTLLNLHRDRPRRVGVVGLGTGTIAAYGGPADYYCFYEINPNVLKIARSQFTFLADSAAQIEVVLGDARLMMERQEPQAYDIIALDAFSGDAIPVHLLTQEAFELYFRHLRPDGVIAVHISNRHLDLKPVVGGIAQAFDVPIILIESEEDGYAGEASSDWLLLTRNQEFLDDPAVSEVAVDVQGTYTPVRPWTDQYSNLFQIMDSIPEKLRSALDAWSRAVERLTAP